MLNESFLGPGFLRQLLLRFEDRQCFVVVGCEAVSRSFVLNNPPKKKPLGITIFKIFFYYFLILFVQFNGFFYMILMF